jgi:hypothetical protein
MQNEHSLHLGQARPPTICLFIERDVKRTIPITSLRDSYVVKGQT